MKRFFTIFAIVISLIFFTSCPSPNAPGSKLPELQHSTSDWLFVMYMDADNNLNESIWADLFNAQLGISNTLNDDGTANDEYPSIKVVMLWDGWSAEKCQENDTNRIHPQSEVYELGPMDINTYNLYEGNNKSWLISSYSKRLTEYAYGTWLSAEPDMGDVNTLKKFLSWVNGYYSATNKVLILNNHGAGTEREAGSGGAFYHRSLCSDDTNSSSQSKRSLTATDVKNAITDSGFHPNVLCMDCCLQGNVETTYILRGSADYLVTSANTSYSNNYHRIISNLNNINTPLEFAQCMASSYALRHKDHTLTISTTDPENSQTRRSSYERTLTQAVYDLNVSKQGLLYSTINALANAILSKDDEVKTRIFTDYLNQTRTSVQNCKGMTYPGTCVYLSDIGYFCNNLISDSSLSNDIRNCAHNVVNALNNVIVSSWMGKYVTSYDSNTAANPTPVISTDFYYKKNLTDVTGTSHFCATDGQFGLTIMTQTYDNRFNNGYYYFLTEYSEWTGYSPNWGQLLAYWYNNISNPSNP